MLVSVERLPLAVLARNRFAQMLKIRLNQGTLETLPSFIYGEATTILALVSLILVRSLPMWSGE